MPHSSIHIFNANKASTPDFSDMEACDFILIFQVNHFLIAICCSFIGCIVSIDLHPILIHQIKLLLQLIYYLFSLSMS